MSTVAAGREDAPALPRPWLARALDAVPLLTIFACFALLYTWQAWRQPTPWIFFDELYYARLAQSIVGGSEVGGLVDGFAFETLYAYLIAPAWLIDDTHAAYEAAKYIGVLTMTAAAFPAYWLARLLVLRPLALFVAAATVAAPALTFSSLLMQETLAYPYATLCAFLLTKAIATWSPRWLAGAGAASIVAPLVRDELLVVPPAFAVAAVLVGFRTEWARRRYESWSRTRWLALALGLGAALLATHLVLSHVSHEWATAAEQPGRMLDYGLWAAGALVIGVGVLPAVVGLAALVRPGGEAPDPAVRAFVAVFGATTAGYLLYTAGKGAYLSLTFGDLIEERNLFYAAPLLFTATALWLRRLRVHPLALATSATLVAVLVVALPYRFPGFPAADTPTFSFLWKLARELGWSESALQGALLVLVAATVGVAAAAHAVRPRRPLGFLVAAVAVLVLAWNVAVESVASDAARDFSDSLLTTQPVPLDWIDRQTEGSPALYIGQQLTDSTQVMLQAFWNRNLSRLWSVDATQGPIEQTGIASPDGRLLADPAIRHVVTDGHVEVVGKRVLRNGLWQLYEIRPPLRVLSIQTGVYGDGWTTAHSTYSRFSTPGGRRGFISILLTRQNWCPRTHVPGEVRIEVGKLGFAPQGRLRMGQVTTARRWPVHPCRAEEFVLHTPPPPFRVEVSVTPTFVPVAVDPAIRDDREVGVQVSYGFTATRPPAAL